MVNVKQAQWFFKISTIAFIAILVFGFWKINNLNKDYAKLNNMPISEYKIMSQKNLSSNDDIKVFQYKVVVNGNIDTVNLKTIVEEIVTKAKASISINGISILMYSNPNELQGDCTVAQVVYAPGGNLQRALNENIQGYSDFSYYVSPKTSILRQQPTNTKQTENVKPVENTENSQITGSDKTENSTTDTSNESVKSQ